MLFVEEAKVLDVRGRVERAKAIERNIIEKLII